MVIRVSPEAQFRTRVIESCNHLPQHMEKRPEKKTRARVYGPQVATTARVFRPPRPRGRKSCRGGSSPMNCHGPDWLCGLCRWPWASSGPVHSLSLCLAQRTVQSAPRQGVRLDAEPVLNRPTQVWVASGVAMLGTRWTLTGICCHPAQAGAESSVLVCMSSVQHRACRWWAVEQEGPRRCL